MDTTLSRTTVILCPRLDLSMTKTALLLIDIQNDFIPPNGSLAVNGGDQILTAVYRILDEAADHFDLVVASLACLTDLRVAFHSFPRLTLRLSGLCVLPMSRKPYL